MTKAELRRKFRALPCEGGVLVDAVPPAGSCIMLFWPLPDEVDTRPFIRQCYASGVQVVLPVVEGDDIILRQYKGGDNLALGAFNILEPQGEMFSHLEKISRVYVPGMAFSSTGARLGRGRGYYDRFLPLLSPEVEFVGVCAKGRRCEEIPMEAHDVRMHRVIFCLWVVVCGMLSLVGCQRKTPTDNPAFVQVMDTTGADDPYIYEGDSAYTDEIATIRRVQHSWRLRQEVHRSVRAPYINKEKGIISTHDDLFRSAAALTGWDWRLIAAQCYQESGFDPMARSGAGARGLMQIMPGTAKHLGLPMSEIHNPSANVAAAARYIRELSSLFSDIHSAEERIHFVLAAYNGGYNHIRDAMALCRKYGGSPQRWADVSRYVLGLQQPRYYRDPVVKHGYMIGSETSNYVASVIQRARQYGANLAVVALPPGWKAFTMDNTSSAASSGAADSVSVRPTRPRPTNRFTRHNSEVLRPEELGGVLQN